MKLEYKFRHMEWSDELVGYVEDRFRKLQKFELKPIHVQITFSKERYDHCADVHVNGRELSFQARARSSSFYESIDRVVAKLHKQLAKRKERVQNHRCYANTHEGKMERLTPELEFIEAQKKAA